MKHHTYLSLSLSVFWGLFITFGAISVVQAQQKNTGKSQLYINLSAGVDRLSFRDNSTSPLIYKGLVPTVTLGFDALRRQQSRWQVQGQYTLGTASNQVGVEHSASKNYVFWLRLQHLRLLSKRPKVSWYFGGTADLANTIRVNPKLMNNQLGMDFIQTLFATTVLEVPLQSSVDKKINFHLFKIKNKAQNQKYLSFKLSVPFWFSSYRNGYSYANQSGVINGLSIFNGYEFRVWNGFRLASKIAYNKILHNKNRYEVSYLWDAYRVGLPSNDLTVAHHALQFSLWYNIR